MQKSHSRSFFRQSQYEDYLSSLMSNQSSLSVQLPPRAQDPSSCCNMMSEELQTKQIKGSQYDFKIIYFERNSKASIYEDSQRHFLQKSNVDMNQDNRQYKYRIGSQSIAQYVSQNQLRRKHYQFVEFEQRKKEKQKLEKVYGLFPKPSKPIHRYFNRELRCNNCKRKGHHASNCKQQNSFFLKIMRNASNCRGLIIDVDPSAMMESYDY